MPVPPIIIELQDAWEGIEDCRHCKLRESALFSGLQESDFEKIHKPIEQIEVQPGDFLYRMDQKGDSIYTIRTGTFKLSQLLSDGTYRIVRIMDSADVTGLELMHASQYDHDAIALTQAEVCRIPVKLVQELAESCPGLHRDMMKRYQQALKYADKWLTEFSTGSAKQRVARLVLCLVEKSQGNPRMFFSREDIGAILGITTETASRTIAEFKRLGLISEKSRYLQSADQDRLKVIAYPG